MRTAVALPFHAETGFTGLSPTHHQGSGGGVPHQELLTSSSFSIEELRTLDSEGRVVVTDHGACVLFNIYGPAITSEDEDQARARMTFKMNFFRALECRWNALLAAGRTVVVVGDLNIAPRPIDYPDYSPEKDFYKDSRPDRRWMRSLLGHQQQQEDKEEEAGGGDYGVHRFIDCFRVFHSTRRDAFTVWSTATGARVNNYGSRIDLTLAAGKDVHVGTTPVSPPPPQVENLHDVLDKNEEQQQQQQEEEGSRRRSNNEVARSVFYRREVGDTTTTTTTSTTTTKKKVMFWVSGADIEPTVQGSDHCPVWLDVCSIVVGSGSGGGENLEIEFPCAATAPPCAMRFFAGKQTKLLGWLANTSTSNKTTTVAAMDDNDDNIESGDAPEAAAAAAAVHEGGGSVKRTMSPVKATGKGVVASRGGRGSQQGSGRSGIGKQQQQMSLTAFVKPKTQDSTSMRKLSPLPKAAALPSPPPPPIPSYDFMQAELAAAAHQTEKQRSVAKGAWQAIQQKMQAPKCRHGETASLKKTNKAGPNHGRYFYMCARSQGLGDEAQCSFFKWTEKRPGDAPRTVLNQSSSSGDGGGGGVSNKRSKLQ